MSKEKNQNKSLTNYEEQNRQLVNALYAQKLVKPTCSDCEDYFSAMVSILTKRGFEQESFERELRLCIRVGRLGDLHRLMLRRPEARITIHGLIICTVMT